MPFYVKGEKIYHYLNAFGLTPWMCLHLFYIMILYLYTWMAAGNVLVFYCILSVIKAVLPDTAFRLGFTNGLMSESMIFFFILIWIVGSKTAEK